MADVTIYTRMMCGYCAAAKRLLDQYLELATIGLFVLFVLGIAVISYLH